MSLFPQDCGLKVISCGPRQWACGSGDQCVPDFWHCDGQSDCRDGSDEAGCKCRASSLRQKQGLPCKYHRTRSPPSSLIGWVLVVYERALQRRDAGMDCKPLVESHPLSNRCSTEVPGFRVPVYYYWCLPQLQHGV